MRNEGTGFVPKTIRRDAAHGLTASKYQQLRGLGLRFADGRRRYLRGYWHPKHLAAILTHQSALVEHRRQLGWLSPSMSAHQNKVCMESSLGILRGSWQAAIRKTMVQVLRDATMVGEEKGLTLRILRDPALLQTCLLGGGLRVADPLERRVSRRLRRLVLRSRGRMPKASDRLWFDLDCNLYRAFVRDADRHFRGAWIAVTGLRPRNRIYVPLSGVGVDEFASRTALPSSGPTIRVVVGERVTFYALVRIPARRRLDGVAGGIDKGFNTLLTLSTGDPEASVPFGPNAAALIADVADSAIDAARLRRRIRAHERSLRNADADKARRIRRNNLGARRSGRRFHRDRARLREQVNRALNSLFQQTPDLSQLFCEDLAFRASPIARSLNRRLGRWLKGYLHERLMYKAELNGVGLTVVNAAYTSQSCPRCWFASKSNRRGERFECAHCGYTGSSDAVAATNVLRRGSDPAITRFMSPGEVKQILEARWRSARTGRAWGSNEAVPALDAPRDIDSRQSREQPVALDGATGPHGGALLTAPSKPGAERGPALSR